MLDWIAQRILQDGPAAPLVYGADPDEVRAIARDLRAFSPVHAPCAEQLELRGRCVLPGSGAQVVAIFPRLALGPLPNTLRVRPEERRRYAQPGAWYYNAGGDPGPLWDNPL
jgi:hypothetical protein